MKITFEGCECSFSMGAISFECDPKETEALLNADVRKHEISEGDLTSQIKQSIYAVVKDAMGKYINDKPIYTPLVPTPKPEPTPAGAAACMPNPNPPTPAGAAACMPNPNPPTPAAGAACAQPTPVPEKVAAMERSEPEVELVDIEEAPKKKFGPKQRRASANK